MNHITTLLIIVFNIVQRAKKSLKADFTKKLFILTTSLTFITFCFHTKWIGKMKCYLQVYVITLEKIKYINIVCKKWKQATIQNIVKNHKILYN